MNWIKRTLWEIDRSSSLAWLGTLISVSFLFIYFFWSSQDQLFKGDFVQPLLCWDFLPQCSQKIPFPAGALNWLFIGFVALSSLSLVLFFIKRSIGFAWTCLLFAWSVYALVYALDASLRSNILGFFVLLGFGYLFIPNKQKLTRYLFLSFYLVDVYLKLNADWLSGLPLYGSIDVPVKGLEWIASFSVLIQLIMPFFLISNDGQRMGYGFAALFFYHLFHFYVQGDPGHLILAMLLLFFIFDYFETKRIQRETMYQSYEHPEPSSIWWPVLVALFCVSQLSYAKGRFPLVLFQLEKPIGSVECQLITYANFKQKVELVDLNHESVPSTFKCHPMVNFNMIKTYCDRMKKDNQFDNVTAFFLTRKLSDESYKVRFKSDRFCDSSYQYVASEGLSE